MPTASAKGFRNYRKLKGRRKAKDFQKLQVEDWLDHEIDEMPLSDIEK